MPVLHGAVTFARFEVRAEQFDPKRSLPKGLKAHAFEPIDRKRGADQDRAAGFVELEDPDGVEFATSNLYAGQHARFAYRVDQLKIPSAALKSELAAWVAEFEGENARKPSRQEKARQRDAIRDTLRSAAVPTTKTFDVSWELTANRLKIWATSRKIVEEIQAAIEQAFGVKLEPLVPVVLAGRLGVDDAALAPTAALLGVELKGQEEEAIRGAA